MSCWTWVFHGLVKYRRVKVKWTADPIKVGSLGSKVQVEEIRRFSLSREADGLYKGEGE